MASALRRTGVEVIAKGVSKYISDLRKVNRAYADMGKAQDIRMIVEKLKDKYKKGLI